MSENLILINGNYYYLDIDEISNFIQIQPEDTSTLKRRKKIDYDDFNSSNMVNVTKYDMVKMMIEVICNTGFSLNDTGDMDETEKLIKGVNEDDFNAMPIPFKLAFNTLLTNKIIKIYEPTNRKSKRGDSETKK